MLGALNNIILHVMDGTYDYKYYRVIFANIAVNLHVPDKKSLELRRSMQIHV